MGADGQIPRNRTQNQTCRVRAIAQITESPPEFARCGKIDGGFVTGHGPRTELLLFGPDLILLVL